MQSASTFPSYIAFEDSVVSIGFDLKRDPLNASSHVISAVVKNKTGSNISSINLQVAAQKYMTLKMRPASGNTLGPMAQNLTQDMDVVNSAEGQKPLSVKMKINYTVEGQAPVSQIKVIQSLPNNY
mmetsp:Transcript_21890/g.33985  ORF Transcript_21890/g.33985 Transcript_21890/m.33985 type:complete len:126 (+) Transcript_21890:2247-2624(+)